MSKAVIRASSEATSFESVLKPALTLAESSKSRHSGVLAQIKEEAWQSGYADGHVAGFSEGNAQGAHQAKQTFADAHAGAIESFVGSLELLVKQTNLALPEFFRSCERSMAELVCLLTAKIIAKEFRSDDQLIVEHVRTALAEVTHTVKARIRLNPADCTRVEASIPQIRLAAASLKEIEVVEDETIVGGCVIESEGGIVDAQLDALIAEALVQIREAA